MGNYPDALDEQSEDNIKRFCEGIAKLHRGKVWIVWQDDFTRPVALKVFDSEVKARTYVANHSNSYLWCEGAEIE